MQLRAEHTQLDVLCQGLGLLEAIVAGEKELLHYLKKHRTELPEMQYWLSIDQFNRKIINQRLKHYAQGNPAWRERGGL